MAKPRLIADCTKELLDDFHAKARRNGMTMGQTLNMLAEKWLAEEASASGDRYKVTLPVVIDGLPRVPGDVISLPIETAREYSHALIRVETTLGHASATELPVFRCHPDHIPQHRQLEAILNDPEERGGIVANLKWGSYTVETKGKTRRSGRI